MNNIFKKKDSLNFLLKNISEAIFVFDTNYIITNWNKGAEIIYGWKAKEALGQSIDIIQSNLSNNKEIQKTSFEIWQMDWQFATKNKKRYRN